MKKITKKYVEATIDRMFRELADRVQFNIMDLGKVLNPSEECLKTGGSEQMAAELMAANVQKYRVN